MRLNPFFNCPDCGKLHVFPAFSRSITCSCGRIMSMSDVVKLLKELHR